VPEIIDYEPPDGSCPFEMWFESLDPVVAARVATAIDRMADGNRGDVKPVGEGVSERRIDFGPGYRVYFGQDGRDLTCFSQAGRRSDSRSRFVRPRCYGRNTNGGREGA
jgi:putative addiction module killer protein